MKPPSIWPRSMAGFSDLPTSCRMSTASIRCSPVSVSIATSVTAAPYAKVEERAAGQRLAVVVDLGRRVKAGGGQLHAREIRHAREFSEGQGLGARVDDAVAELDDLRIAVELARGIGGEPLAQRARGIARGHAVDVAAGRGGRGRRVGHLARVRRGHADRRHRHAQLLRDDLLHLGEEALAHLRAAVVEEQRAVVVQVQQRARLVVMRGGERDAELDRRERQAALDHRIGAIPAGDLRRRSR